MEGYFLLKKTLSQALDWSPASSGSVDDVTAATTSQADGEGGKSVLCLSG